MKAILMFVLSFFLLGFQLPTKDYLPKYQAAAASVREGDAMHRIAMVTVAEGAGCSATAVGPHTILTAGHCVIGGTAIVIVDGKPAHIVGVQYDGNDHALFVLNQNDISFDTYVGIDEREPRNGERIRMWGNPGSSRHVYREGYFQVKSDFVGADGQKRDLYIYILPVFPGDSGSGMISDDGKVIEVVSMGNENAQSQDFLLQFSPDQLAAIK